jgi:hypothetical protein
MSNQQAITFAQVRWQRVLLRFINNIAPTLCCVARANPLGQVAMSKGLAPQQAAQALVEEALSAHSVTPASRDNVTVMVVQFAPCPGPAV